MEEETYYAYASTPPSQGPLLNAEARNLILCYALLTVN